MTNHLRIEAPWLQAVMGPARHLFDLAAYEFLYRLSPARSNKFFNGGYLPLAPDFQALPEFENEQHCAMMYHFVGQSHLADLNMQPRKVLDVGCGQGGGLHYLSTLFPDAEFVGTDRNATVVRLARRNLRQRKNVSFVKATGNSLRFPEKSFDLVLSVGAPTYFPLTTYISEAARIVAPGGIISFSAGYRQHAHELVEAEVKQSALDNGLDFVRYTDITPNTFASLKADIPRRIELLNRVPWPFRSYGHKWSDLPGSPEYQEYEEGQRTDFAVVLRARS